MSGIAFVAVDNFGCGDGVTGASAMRSENSRFSADENLVDCAKLLTQIFDNL